MSAEDRVIEKDSVTEYGITNQPPGTDLSGIRTSSTWKGAVRNRNRANRLRADGPWRIISHKVERIAYAWHETEGADT